MRIILVFLLTFSILTSFAQTIRFESPITLDKSKLELHTISDKSNSFICNVVVNKDSISVLVHDTSFRIINSFPLTRRKKENFLGGFINNNRLFIYFDSNNDTTIHSWALDLATGGKDESLISINKKADKPVKYISNDGHFVSITVNKKTSDISVNDFYNGTQCNTLKYHLNFDKWVDWFKTDTVDKELPQIEYIRPSSVFNLNQSICPYKFYLENDSLNLVINNQMDITKVICFSLKNQKTSDRLIRHHLCSSRPGYTSFLLFKGNSFVFKNKLYYVQVSTDSLCVQVCNFNSGQIIKTFTAQKKDPIWFMNSDITQQTERDIDIDTINRTRTLLKKMYNNDVVVVPFEITNGIEITIGASQLMQSSGGGGGFGGSYMGGFNTPGGYVPSIYVPSTGGSFFGFGQSGFRKFTLFKMQLDSSANHIDGAVNFSLVEKLIQYKDKIKTTQDTENLFVLNGTNYYSYFDKKKKAIAIVAL